MKQILKLVFLLVIGQTAFGQAPSNYTNINGRYRWIAGMFDSTFHIPKGSTPSLRTGGSTNSGGLFYNTSDSSVYTYTGTQWIKLRGSINPSDTTNKYVTQVYKKSGSDSIFYVKGGVHTWAFNDSTGSPGGGGGGKVYYFNGGVSMGTIGGFQMYELGDTANTGAAANFTRSTTGNIANFITDVNKPGLLQIPAGVWSVDAWLSESGGGSNHAEIYVIVEKWNGSSISTIATSPVEQITEGNSPNLYTWSVSIPTTTLAVTDRIIIQFYIQNTNGKTVTLYTQNGYVGEVHTTFTTGIGAINGLTAPAQYLVTGTSGTDFNINSSTATHTFNLPTASATNRGALSTTDWSTFNNKIGGSLVSGYLTKATAQRTIDTSQFFQNGQNVGLGTIVPDGRLAIVDTGGFALKINYNSASTDANNNAALYAENNGLSSYVAILNEKTTNNTGGQYPILIESSLTSGTAQSGMATGIHFGVPDDAGNRKVTQLALRTTDPAAATYTNRAELRLWNNGSLSTPYYLLGNGNMGLGTSTPDSNLTVVNGALFQRGVRMSGLPTGPGTKALRINASGTISIADTLIDAGGTVTSVATNTGTGITGGTITTSGTIAADTLLLSTRAWRQKGVDSISSLINTRISGTTNYIPKFTSSSAIGNSIAYELNGNDFRIDNVANYRGLGILTQTASARPTLSFVNTNTAQYGSFIQDINGALAFGRMNYDFGGHSEAMRLTSGGLLGLGTSSPNSYSTNANNLVVYEAGNAGITIATGTTNEGALYFADGTTGLDVARGVVYYNHTSNFMGFATDGSERMRLDASGNLGIGTSSPTSPLTVYALNNTAAIRVTNGPSANNAGITLESLAGNVVLNNGNGPLEVSTGGSLRMTLSTSGNLGLGVTPSAWETTTFKALQIGTSNGVGSLVGRIDGGSTAGLLLNAYYGSGGWTYIGSSFATYYAQNNGQHIWFNAPSGTAGSAISFTQAMTLDASGRLGIGQTSPQYRLDVYGGARIENAGEASITFRNNTWGNFTIGQSAYSLGGGFLSIGAASAIMTFDGTNQRVGIGTTSPAALTEINPGSITNGGAAKFAMAIRSGSTTFLDIYQGYNSTIAGQSIFGTTLQSSDALAFATNNTERMRITSGGDVVIAGTTATNTAAGRGNITIGGTSNSILNFSINGANSGYIFHNGSLEIMNSTSNPITFGTALNERMRITSGGNVLVGTTTDGGIKFDVKGDARVQGGGAVNYAVLNLLDNTSGGSNWAILSGFPNLGDFTIRESGVQNSFILKKTTGNLELLGSIKTAAPSGGTAQPWKLGSKVTQGGILALDVSNYIEVEINGQIWKLAIVN